ncbi:unnamed protein product [Blepharisma stoltei]|uniref:F-box domain-containing protein n=1 Tax=Blepharisma stoltei TaxID=1481888 RepID=A0AAU9K5S9_9CILI|nr:unnamed protein product [Blepharisma stoltei]
MELESKAQGMKFYNKFQVGEFLIWRIFEKYFEVSDYQEDDLCSIGTLKYQDKINHVMLTTLPGFICINSDSFPLLNIKLDRYVIKLSRKSYTINEAQKFSKLIKNENIKSLEKLILLRETVHHTILSGLSKNMIVQILQFLSNDDLLRIPAISLEFSMLMKDQKIWNCLYINRFENTGFQTSVVNWKKAFFIEARRRWEFSRNPWNLYKVVNSN